MGDTRWAMGEHRQTDRLCEWGRQAKERTGRQTGTWHTRRSSGTQTERSAHEEERKLELEHNSAGPKAASQSKPGQRVVLLLAPMLCAAR